MFNIGIWKFTKIGKAFKFLERKVDRQVILAAAPVAKKRNHGNGSVNPMTPENQSKAHDMYVAGVRVLDIAETLGYGRTTIQRAIRREKVLVAEFEAAKKESEKIKAARSKANDEMTDRSKPIKFDPKARYESVLFENYSIGAAYERLIRAVEKRGGMALVTFPAHNMPRKQFHTKVSSNLYRVSKKLRVKATCRLAGNGLNEVLVEVK